MLAGVAIALARIRIGAERAGSTARFFLTLYCGIYDAPRGRLCVRSCSNFLKSAWCSRQSA